MPRGVQVRTKNHGLGNHGNLPGPGPGRPKGVPNKFNGQLKEALLSAFNGAHPDGLASWVLQEAKANPTAAWRFWGGSSPSRRKAHWTPLLSFVMSMKPRIKRSWCSRAGGLSSLWHCSGMGSGFGGQKLPGEALGDRSSDFASALASPSSRPTYMDMPWHLSVARSRSDPPAGFILPCRPTLGAAPPTGPSGAGLALGPSPVQASPALSAADPGAGREEICPSRWRAGLPLLPRRARCR